MYHITNTNRIHLDIYMHLNRRSCFEYMAAWNKNVFLWAITFDFFFEFCFKIKTYRKCNSNSILVTNSPTSNWKFFSPFFKMDEALQSPIYRFLLSLTTFLRFQITEHFINIWSMTNDNLGVASVTKCFSGVMHSKVFFKKIHNFVQS